MEDILSAPPPDTDRGLLNKPLLHANHTPASPQDPNTVDKTAPSAIAAEEEENKKNGSDGGDGNGDDSVPTPWLLVVGLAMMYCVFSGIENGMSPSTFTTWQAEFNNASTTAIVSAHSMTEVFKIVGAPLVGHFCNRIKPLAICIGAVIWCIGSFLIGGAQDVWMLFVGFSIIGFGFSFLTVLTPAELEVTAPRNRVAMLLGIIYCCAPLGVAIFFVVGGLTADTEAWRFVFALVAPVVTVVPLVLLSVSVMKDLCSAGARNVAETAMAAIAEPDLPYFETIRKFVCDRVILLILAELTFQTFYISAAIALLPKYLESLSDKSTASFVLAATVPAALVGTLLGGIICKRWSFGLKDQMKFCFWTNLAVVPLTVIVFADPKSTAVPFGVQAVILPAAMFIVFLNASPSISLMALLCKTKKEVARLQSLLNVVSRTCGAIPGPIILGAMIDASDHVDASSPLAFSHCYLIICLVGGFCTVLCAGLALCLAPDIAAVGQFGDEPETPFGPNAKKAMHEESGDGYGSAEMRPSLGAGAAADSSPPPVPGGGGVAFPSVLSDGGTSHQETSKRAAGAVVLPKMVVTEPSRSPDRNPLSGRELLPEPDRVAAEWQSADLLHPPHHNDFVAAENEGEEAAAEEGSKSDDFL